MIAAILGLACLGMPASAGAGATASGTGGAASTVDRLATKAAIDTLRDGGNAVDAAVAAAGVLGVTEPFSSGIGGGGFMLVRTPDGQVTAIDGREAAPRRCDRARSSRAASRSTSTPRATAGSPRACRARSPPGSWRSTATAAARSPRRSSPGSGSRARAFGSTAPSSARWSSTSTSSRTCRRPPISTSTTTGRRATWAPASATADIARAYERIARLGARGFYRGPIAAAIASAARRPPVAEDADNEWRPGLLRKRDLKRYEALARQPTLVNYRGYDVWGMPPPSSGGSTVGEALNILEGYTPLGADRTEALHRFIEASRYAFADRNAYLADPAFFDVPLDGPPVRLVRGRAPSADHRRGGRRRAGLRGRPGRQRAGGPDRDRPRGQVDDPPHGRRRERDDRLVHVHDRVDRRQRDRRAGLGLSAQQRAHRLRLRRSAAPERPRRGQAPAQLDGADDRDPRRRAGPGAGLARRLDDHHHGAPAAGRAPRPRARPSRRRSPRPAPSRATRSGPRPSAPSAARRKGAPSAATYGHEFIPVASDPPELGAATAIELLADGGLLAAAEPKRRGGGSAMVVAP